MENLAQKEQFLRSGFVTALHSIPVNAAAIFGKMNPQQMAEHMAEYIRLGYGNPVIDAVYYTEESLPKVRAFILSEKPFRDNTPNPILGENPKPLHFANYNAALEDVEKAVLEFFEAFRKNDKLSVASPFFGMLNFEETVHLLHKHARHHLRQFNILN